MSQRLLTEEQRRLMGISPREFGGLPALFQPAKFVVDPTTSRPLEERRTMTLFPGVQEMKDALERAHKLVSRVNATIQSNRKSSSRAVMNEKSRAEMYRLDQEMVNALDSIRASSEALEALDQAEKMAAREAKQRRRQGR